MKVPASDKTAVLLNVFLQWLYIFLQCLYIQKLNKWALAELWMSDISGLCALKYLKCRRGEKLTIAMQKINKK